MPRLERSLLRVCGPVSLLASFVLSAGCATQRLDEGEGGVDVVLAEDRDPSMPDESSDAPLAPDVPASQDVPATVDGSVGDAPVVVDRPDVVAAPDLPGPADVVVVPDVLVRPDVVALPDVVLRPDVVLPMDVVLRPDVVLPMDVGECVNGAMRGCYTGPSWTRGVGACRDGTQVCSGGSWAGCTGQVLPASAERCGNGVDETCDGMTDEGCPTMVTGPQVSALSVGNVHACVTNESRQSSCWGGNPFGQIGSLPATGATRPTRLASHDGVQLASNENFLCLRRADGSVACTGSNTYGQLGDGSTTQRSAPVTVAAARGATWITAGYYHACAVVGGGVRCWGRNESRQLGDATTSTCMSSPCATAPVTVPGITGAVQVVAGLSYSCALLGDGTVRCWGDNSAGQIGIGTTDAMDRGVTMVPGLTEVVQLAGGYQHVCAVRRDGTVWCWGANTYGTFLDAGMGRPAPTAIPGLSGVAQLALSVHHACARLTNGALRCWGYNGFGQIGDGTTTSPRAMLTAPLGLPPVADVAVGYWRTCARTASQAVWCWGWNLSGGVGDGTSSGNRTSPVQIVP